MEKIADVIKLFLDKYFVPTLISTATSIVIVAKGPDILQISEKIGEVLYFILIFCTVFLIVLLACKVYETILSKIVYLKGRKQHQEYVEIENRKAMDELWTFVDKLSVPDKRALFKFLKTNNAPIESSAIYFSDSIFGNGNIMCETIVEVKQDVSRGGPNLNSKNGNLVRVPIEQMILQTQVKRYKLKDEFFHILKYSYDNYKRISHFEEDNQYDKP